jgi:type VI secretion system protein ImpK
MSDELYVPSVSAKPVTVAATLPAARSYSGQTYASHSYYRSKLFTIETANNQLIAAAMPLVCLLARLHSVTTEPDLNKLNQQLIHEINAFCSLIQGYSYPFEILVVSRYILCVTFDEWIFASNWSYRQAWQKLNLVTALQSLPQMMEADNVTHTQNMILITEHLVKNPQEHLDILELIYLCLTHGFQDDRELGLDAATQQPLTVTDLKDCIFKAIQRPDLSVPALFMTGPQLLSSPQIDIVERIPRPILYAGAGALGSVTTLYFLMNYLLKLLAAPLATQIAALY